MNVTAVIVNYRTPELTLNCLQTLAAEREEVPQLQVCVVEGAQEIIQQHCSKRRFRVEGGPVGSRCGV